MSAGRLAAFLRVYRHPQLRRSLLAYLLFSSAELGVWVILLVYAHSVGDASTVGFIAVVQLVPAALLAPGLASLVDRLPRAAAPALTYGVVTVSLAATGWALASGAPFWMVVAPAVVANTLITACRPAHHSLTPCLATGPAELVASNVVATAAEAVGLFLGPAVAGVVLAFTNPATGMFVWVGTLLLATLLTLRFPAVKLPHFEEHATEGVIEGLRLLRRERSTQPPVLITGVQGFLEGAVDILIVVLALEVLGMGDGGPGFLNAVLGVGAIVGSLAASSLVGRIRLAPPLLMTALVAAGAMALVGVFPSASILFGVLGITYALVRVITRTMVQRFSPVWAMGRMFGLLEGVTLAGLAVGAASVPLMVRVVGTEMAFVILAMALPGVVLLSWSRLGSADRHADVPALVLSVLRSVETLAGLQPAALEAMARGARLRTLGPGETVIAEGDDGDEMFVLVEGKVEVARQGRRVATVGAGEMIGEMALMSDASRIATVTTIGPTKLVVVDRDGFLSALTTEPAVRRAVEAMAAVRRRETLGHEAVVPPEPPLTGS